MRQENEMRRKSEPMNALDLSIPPAEEENQLMLMLTAGEKRRGMRMRSIEMSSIYFFLLSVYWSRPLEEELYYFIFGPTAWPGLALLCLALPCLGPYTDSLNQAIRIRSGCFFLKTQKGFFVSVATPADYGSLTHCYLLLR